MGKRKRKSSQAHIKKKIRKLEKRLRDYESSSSSDDSDQAHSSRSQSRAESVYYSDYSEVEGNMRSVVHTVNADIHQERLLESNAPSAGPVREPIPSTAADQQTMNNPEESISVFTPATHISENILVVLGDPKGKVEVFGPKIQDEVSKRWGRILCEGLNKDQKKALMEKILVPENFQLVKAPKLNAEIVAVMNESTKNRDKRLEKAQNQLGMGIAALTDLTSTLIERDIDKMDIIKKMSEINQLLLDLHYENTINRRKLITYSLDKKFVETVHEVQRDSLLFGENLAEKIKATKSAEKSGLQVKKTNTAETSTFKKPTYQQGNWKGPPRQAQRGNRQGGGRSRPAYRSSRRSAPAPDRYQSATNSTKPHYKPPPKTQ